MRKSAVFAAVTVASFFLSFSFFPEIGASSLASPQGDGVDIAPLALSLFFFVLSYSLVGVSAMVDLKKPLVYAGVAVASLLPILFFGFSIPVAVVSAALFLSGALYYHRTHAVARNMIHFSALTSSELALPFSLTIFVAGLTAAVFLSSSGVPIEALLPDQVIDMSVGVIEGQVDSLGCSMDQTVKECASTQASRQLEGGRDELYAQCDPLKGTPAYSPCIDEIEAQEERLASSITEEAAGELKEAFGAESEDDVLRDVAREAIRERVMEVVSPYAVYLPFFVAAAALTLLGSVAAAVKMAVPFVSMLLCRGLIFANFLSVEKVEREVDVLE